MVDIGITVRLNGAYNSVPSTPGNGQEGTPTNDIAFTGTSFKNNLLNGSIIPTFSTSQQSHKIDGLVNLPIPTITYYSLTANLTAGNVREYWTDVTPSLINSPSGSGAYVSGSLIVLGSFQVVGSISIPKVTAVSPVIADPTININLVIYGTDFIPGATVTINGVAATSVVVQASNTITCVTPIIGTIGSVNILVTNPNLRSSASSGNGLLTTVAAPTVTSITPNTGPSGTAITDLHGTGFYPGATVVIGGDPATSVVYVSPTQLTCVIGTSAAIGIDNVVVTNVTGQTSGASGNGLFTVTFTPAVLNLTMWQRAPFVSLPFNGTASAGNSGNIKIAHLATDPTVGAPLNGLNGMHFNRTPQNAIFQTTGGAGISIDSGGFPLVSNTDYTISFLVDIFGAGKHDATPHQAPQFMAADAHWGWGFSCDAQLSGTPNLTFTSGTNTIVRSAGDWASDGWTTTMPVYIRGTVSNDGTAGGATVTNVTTTTLTLSGGVVTESVTGTANVCVSSGGRVNVFNYIGSFPVIHATCSLGLHWIYVSHTTGSTRIDIDGVTGTPQAITDHTGASGIDPTINYSGYVTNYITWTEYERYTMASSQTTGQRDNYKSYLNSTYGTSF